MTPRRKVLLIDDNDVSLHFASTTLVKAGFEVRTSNNVTEFDAVLGEWHPDVILTDVNMPGMSGGELCRLLKSRYDTAHVPVVLFSALSHAELEALARECGADGFLTKLHGLSQLPDELAQLIDSAQF